MEEENEKDRTEEPTPFKLKRAREKGSIARGGDLGFAVGLTAFLIYAWILGADFGGTIAKSTESVLVSMHDLADGNGPLLQATGFIFSSVGSLVAILAGTIFFFVLLFELIQTGVLFTGHPLKPDFNRLNPAKGLKRLFSARMLLETVKNLFKMAAYATAGWLVISGVLSSDVGEIADAGGLVAVAARTGFNLVAAFLLVAVFFAVIDQIIVRRDYLKRMRMSRREVKRENRDREGEPRLKQKRKEMHGEFVKLSQSLNGMRGADVLIVNPTHISLALRYDPKSMAAPTVVSVGLDRVALRLRNLAFLYGIPIIEDAALARELWRTAQLNRSIPEHCYQSVADTYNNRPSFKSAN